MDNPTPPSAETPPTIAKRIGRIFFGASADPAADRRAIRQWLLGAIESAVLIPAIFYWRFGEVSGLGWGTTFFFVVYCLLSAIGLYFLPRPEFHTPVPLRGDWLDRIGAFWLVACVFGPLAGWFLSALFPLTVDSWRWIYGLRIVLAAFLPLITALALTRYVRGKAGWVALPLLVEVTLLPIWSVVRVSQDYLRGPIIRQVEAAGVPEFYLPYTAQALRSTGQHP